MLKGYSLNYGIELKEISKVKTKQIFIVFITLTFITYCKKSIDLLLKALSLN